MNLSARLMELWDLWRASERPFDNFRHGLGTAPTYKVECDLDHQASYIPELVNAWLTRNPNWDVTKRASHELRDLRTCARKVEELAASGVDGTALRAYIQVTRSLL